MGRTAPRPPLPASGRALPEPVPRFGSDASLPQRPSSCRGGNPSPRRRVTHSRCLINDSMNGPELGDENNEREAPRKSVEGVCGCVCVCRGLPETSIPGRRAQEAKILVGVGVGAGGFFPTEGGIYGDAVAPALWEDGAWCVLGPPGLGWGVAKAPRQGDGQTPLLGVHFGSQGSSVK